MEAALANLTRWIPQQDKLAELASLPREAASLGNRIIMREGVDGGVVTGTEYMIAQLASEMKLTKRTTNKIIKLVKRDDFVPDEIRTDRIQQIESWIEKADGGTIFEYDVWKEGDGQQDLKLYIRNLRTILEDLIADEQNAGYKYLFFELVERDNRSSQLLVRFRASICDGPPANRGMGENVLCPVNAMDDCAAHQPYSVPGTAYAAFFGRIRCADHPPFFREGKGPIFSVRMRRSARAQECRIWQQFVRAQCASVAVCSPTTEDHVCQRALRKAPGGGPGCAY
jgi:hypothetical protein